MTKTIKQDKGFLTFTDTSERERTVAETLTAMETVMVVAVMTAAAVWSVIIN